MRLPGLGEGSEEEDGDLPLNVPAQDGTRLPRDCYVESENDLTQVLEAYSIASSSFFDCLDVDQAGRQRSKLPPALTPNLGLKFRTFDARIDAKYGVRNYFREIATMFNEIDEGIARASPILAGTSDPLKSAIGIVRMYGNGHVYDVQVRRRKKLKKDSIYIRSLEPRPCHAQVTTADFENFEILSDYEDELLLLEQRELLLCSNSTEIMSALLPYAFTYHTLLRLWERGHGNGQTFHLVVADAFRRLRGVTALVELCHFSLGEENLPSQIAVPVLDGFLVASRRETIAEAIRVRWGFKRDRRWGGELAPQDEMHFLSESYLSANGAEYTIRKNWVAVTFMGANDISAWERSYAAQKLNELLADFELDEIARYREWVERSTGTPFPAEYDLPFPDPEEVIQLQREMLPRVDALDERWHILDL